MDDYQMLGFNEPRRFDAMTLDADVKAFEK
jgi:hypothetical protein